VRSFPTPPEGHIVSPLLSHAAPQAPLLAALSPLLDPELNAAADKVPLALFSALVSLLKVHSSLSHSC